MNESVPKLATGKWQEKQKHTNETNAKIWSRQKVIWQT